MLAVNALAADSIRPVSCSVVSSYDSSFAVMTLHCIAFRGSKFVASALCLACVHGIVKMPTGQHYVFHFSSNCRTFIHQPRTDCKPARRSCGASCDCCHTAFSILDSRNTPRKACRSRRTQCNAIPTRQGLQVLDVAPGNTGTPVLLCSVSDIETSLTPSRTSHPRGHVCTQCRATATAQHDNRKCCPACRTDQRCTCNADRVSQCRANCPQVARQLFCLCHLFAPLAGC